MRIHSSGLVPWWLKIILKIILSRLPIKYSRWSRLSIFRHGSMDDPEYAYRVAEKHYNRASKLLGDKFVCMEIGPGDSLLASLCMSAFGASKIYMVDVEDFAVKDVKLYYEMFKFIDSSSEFELSDDFRFNILGDQSDKENVNSPNAIISNLNAHYLTDGIRSLKSIADNSIDFIWSHAVLEHISYSEFDKYFIELYRILKFGGISSHRVDLKDHLSGGLKNLFFSDVVWESNFMSSSGFYTNRIRYSDMIRRFSNVGFDVEVTNIDNWDVLPDRKSFMVKKFSNLSDSELRISGFDILLTKNK